MSRLMCITVAGLLASSTLALASTSAAALSTETTTPQAVTVMDATATVVTKGVNLRVRQHPNTKSKVVGQLKPGAKVTITCYRRGQEVQGKWGKTKIWDRLKTGGYVSDGWLDTGSPNPIVPHCDKPSGGGTSKREAARKFVQAFARKYVGKKVDLDNSGDPKHQCWDLAAQFSKDLGYGLLMTGDGAAKGIYRNYATNGNSKHYIRIAKTAKNLPQPGDIIVWDGTAKNKWGHVAIVSSGTPKKMLVVEQNSPYRSPTRVGTYTSYKNVLGWLRPKKWA